MDSLNRRKFLTQLSLTAAGTAFSSNLFAESNFFTRPAIIEEFIPAETVYGKIKGYREAGVNILLDYLLIFGKGGFPAMGFNGAAIASVLAEATGMIVVLLVLILTGLRKKYHLLYDLKFNRYFNKEILRLSVPLVTQYVISVTTWLVFFLLIEKPCMNKRWPKQLIGFFKGERL